jgi:hypothetical protein
MRESKVEVKEMELLFLSLERESVCLSPFRSILVETGAAEVDSLRTVIVGF